MKAKDLLRRRLHNQHLAQPALKNPTDMLAWLGAVQAQDYTGAKWALGQRLVGATDATLDEAFNAGAILRTHVLRPTWHFLAPADIRWVLALSAPRVHALNATYYRQAELDDATYRRSNAALTKALRDGQCLTRDELAEVLSRAGIERKGLELAYVIMRAELDGLLCSGPRRGKQFTYALLEARVPPARALDAGEALAELVKRYFQSHGPAQVKDFAMWSSLTMADTKRGLDMLGGAVEQETLDGQTYWFAPIDAPAMPTTAYLLPNYDEYTLAYKDRDAFYDSAATRPAKEPRAPSLFPHTVVLDGRIGGMWRRTQNKNVVVETDFFGKLTAGERRRFDAAVQRLGEFVGLPAVTVP